MKIEECATCHQTIFCENYRKSYFICDNCLFDCGWPQHQFKTERMSTIEFESWSAWICPYCRKAYKSWTFLIVKHLMVHIDELKDKTKELEMIELND